VLSEFDALLKAQTHAHEGRVRISRQRALIDKMRQHGYSTKLAEELLAWMEDTQLMFEEHVVEKRQLASQRLERAALLAARLGPGVDTAAPAVAASAAHSPAKSRRPPFLPACPAGS